MNLQLPRTRGADAALPSTAADRVPVRRRKSPFGVRLARSTAALAALTSALILGTGTSASADAIGSAAWGTTIVKDVPIPSGTLFHIVQGSGTRVDIEGASFRSVGQLCQWWIDFDYYDGTGARYFHIQGARHDSCIRDGIEKWRIYRTMRSGPACATLFKTVPGGVKTLARQCHNLHS